MFESGRIYIKTPDDFLLWFNEDAVNSTLWHSKRNYSHEKNERDLLCKYIQNDSTILDVGAGCGIHALTFARVSPYVRVHSFEPAINTFNTLSHNILRNGFQNQVYCHNVALSDKIGETWISTIRGPMDHVIVDSEDRGLNKAHLTLCTTIDKFTSENKLSVSGIKIDVEGVEVQSSSMITSSMRGDFLSDSKTREEFLSFIRREQRKSFPLK